MRHEQLDETIDRVARDLTRLSGESELTTRVRHRIMGATHAPSRAALYVMSGAIAAAVIAVALWNRPETPVEHVPTPAAPVASRMRFPVMPLASSVERATTTVPPQRRSPVTVDVEPLTIAPLMLHTLGEPAPLHVEDIRVADIDLPKDQWAESVKEPR